MADVLLLRKRKLVRHVLIQRNGGEVKFDKLTLPENALVLSGIKAYARHSVTDASAPITALHYYYGVLGGVNASAGDIADLTKAAYTNTEPQFTVSPSAAEYIFFAHPILLSDPSFVYNNFQGGFLDRGTVQIAGADGLLTFRVWRSKHSNLGQNAHIQAIH